MGGHLGRRKLFELMLMGNISHVSPCNTYHTLHQGEGLDSYVSRLAQELDDEFERVGPHSVCAFVAEPVIDAVSRPDAIFEIYFVAAKHTL